MMRLSSRGTRRATGALLVIGSLVLSLLAAAPASAAAPGSTSPAIPPPAAVASGIADLGAATSDGWIGSWGTAMTDGETLGDCSSNCTIRNTTFMSAAGTGVRVTLSNRYGTQPLTIGHATVSVPTGKGHASAVQGSMKDLRFADSQSVTIQPGQEVVSDPLAYAVVAGQDLQVSVFASGNVPKFTRHPSANHKTFRAAGGDKADTLTGSSFTANNGANYIVSGVDVLNTAAAGTIVALGDSITDGIGSSDDKNDRWTDRLAYRMQSLPSANKYGVVNAGISGNRILISSSSGAGERAIDRAAWDVFARPNVKVLVLFMGINDIQQDPSQLDPAKITAGLKAIADEAHSRGIRVVGGTITPWEKWGTYNSEREATRVAVNTWVREQAVATGVYDAIVDFDAALRDPAAATKLTPAYDAGDHLHPGPLGYSAMASSIDLEDLVGHSLYEDGSWVGAWGAPPAESSTFDSCADCTVRTPMRLSISGTRVRVVLSNVFGKQALAVPHTTVALAATPGSAAAQAGSVKNVTFAGSQSVLIPAGEQVLSDPVDLAVTVDQDLLVSSYAPGAPSFDRHAEAKMATYRASGQGDQSAATGAGVFQAGTNGATFLVSRVDVLNDDAAGTIVAFGDSITDGVGADRNRNERWPDRLAQRLGELAPQYRAGIVNTGIGYNRILVDNDQGSIGGQSAMKRFQRDVLNVPGLKTVVVMVGINDIQGSNVLDSARITSGLRVLINSARARGVRVLGATLTPWRGAPGYNSDREATRQGVNTWIRNSGAFDAVVDFDAATGTLSDPARFYRTYDSGDAIHPSAAGYQAMASAIDLAKLGLYASPGAVDVTLSDPPAGGFATVTAKLWSDIAGDAKLALNLPLGWSTIGPDTAQLNPVTAGDTRTARWRVQVPTTTDSQAQVRVTGIVAGRATSKTKTVGISPRPLAGQVAVSTLPFTSVNVGWGTLHRDEDMDGGPIDIGGQTFAKGLVANATATIKIPLTSGTCTKFATTVGVDPDHNGSTAGSVTFEFLLDNVVERTVGTNGDPIKASSSGTHIELDISGKQELTLRATDAGNGANSDHAAWGNPTLTCDAEQLPPTDAALSTNPVAPGTTGWFTGDVAVSASGSGGDGDLYTEIRVADSWSEFAAPVDVPQGEHTYAARASDRWGTTSQVKTLTVRRDSVAPTVSATFTKPNLVVSAQDVTSGLGVVEYRLDGAGPWLGYVAPVALAGTVRSVEYRAADVAGNSSVTKTIATDQGGGTPATPRATPVVTVRPGVARVTYGASASMTVEVQAGSITPTGTVSVTEGGKVVARRDLTAGIAELSLPKSLSVGQHRFVVTYAGDAKVAGATAAADVTVVRAKARARVKVKRVGAKRSKRVRVTTTLSVAGGVQARGTVRVTVRMRKKTVKTRVFRVAGPGLSTTFKVKLPRTGRVKVTAKFSGSTTVAPVTAVKRWRLK